MAETPPAAETDPPVSEHGIRASVVIREQRRAKSDNSSAREQLAQKLINWMASTSRGAGFIDELLTLANHSPEDETLREQLAAARITETHSQQTYDDAQEALLQDFDATIDQLDVGIARENVALDKLLSRLTRKAA